MRALVVTFCMLLAWPAAAQTVVGQKVQTKIIARDDGTPLSCGLRFHVHYRPTGYESKPSLLTASLSMQLEKVASGSGFRPILRMILVGQDDPSVFATAELRLKRTEGANHILWIATWRRTMYQASGVCNPKA